MREQLKSPEMIIKKMEKYVETHPEDQKAINLLAKLKN